MRHLTRNVGLAAVVSVAAMTGLVRFPSWTHDLSAWAPIASAWAQETMKFQPVPAESVSAMERRRADRMARDAERRAETALPAPAPKSPSHPDVPEPPEPPDTPDRPDFSHAGDVVRIGSDIHIEKGQVVEGDVFALRGDIVVDGHVKGNVAATGGNVHLGSTARIDGDVMCIGGKLDEDEGARVAGQRVTALPSGARGRHIERVIRAHGLEDRDWDWFPDRDVRHVTFAISWLICSLLLAWLIARFTPARTGVAVASLKQEPGLSLMLGLGVVLMLVPSVVALALVSAILCITIIGIPLGIGVWVAYAGLLVVLGAWGFVVGVIPVGERFSHRLGQPTALVNAAIFGVLVVSGLRLASELLHFLPLFGWLANLLWVVALLFCISVTLMGAGAILRTKFGQGRDGRWWPLFSSARASMPGETPGASPPPPPDAPPPGPGEPSPAA